MKFILAEVLPWVLCTSLALQPALALPSSMHVSANGPVAAAAPADPDQPVSKLSSLMPIAIVPLSSVSPAILEAQRDSISEQLADLGFDIGAASGMAGQLTPQDLAVLTANPRMMQQAGDMEDTLFVIVCAVLVVGVCVALVIAADDGTVVINT